MRILALLLPACLSCATTGAFAQRSPADEAAVQRVLEETQAGWDQLDAAIFTRHFAQDADWENAFGVRRTGAANVRDFLIRIFPRFQRSELSPAKYDVRFLGPDVAVGERRFELAGQTTPDGRPMLPRRVRTTMLLRREGDEWKVVVYRVADIRREE